MALQAADAVEPSSTSVPWVYLSSLSFLLAGAVFYLALARLLPYSDLGAVVILSAVAVVVPVVFSLGIGPAFQHFLSFYLGRSDTATLKALVRSASLFALVLSASSAAATLALSTVIGGFFLHTTAYADPIAVLAIFVGIQTANSTLQTVLLGLQKFVAYSASYIVGSAAIYGLGLGLFWIHPGVGSIVVGWTVGAGLACSLYSVAILKAIRSWPGASTVVRRVADHNLYRIVLAYSLPLFVWSVLATGALYIDRLILASVADLASVGVYNYALLISSGSLVFVNPFAKILIPRASELFGRGGQREIRDLAQSAVTLAVLVYVPIALGLAALGPFLLRYLAGPGFVSASLPMMILLIVSAVFIPYSILSTIAAGTRRTTAFAKAAGLSLVVNVALSVVLIPRLGMLGAALGNSSMVWVPFLVFYIELRSSGLVRFDLHSLSRIWAASSVMAAVVGVPLWILGYDPSLVPIFVLAGAACLVVSHRILGAISEETALILLRVVPRSFRFLRKGIYWLASARGDAKIRVTSGTNRLLQR